LVASHHTTQQNVVDITSLSRPILFNFHFFLTNTIFPYPLSITPKTHTYSHPLHTLLLFPSLKQVQSNNSSFVSPSDRDDHKVFVFSVMGSCSSVPRKANADMKFKLSLGSKSEKLVIPPSPIKGQPPNGDFKWSTARSTTTFTDHGTVFFFLFLQNLCSYAVFSALCDCVQNFELRFLRYSWYCGRFPLKLIQLWLQWL